MGSRCLVTVLWVKTLNRPWLSTEIAGAFSYTYIDTIREGPHGGSLEQANGSEGPQKEMQPYSKQSCSGVSRCFFAIYLYPFSPLRAGDGGPFSIVAEAYVKKRALVAGSL